MTILDTLRTIRQEVQNVRKDFLTKPVVILNEREKKIVCEVEEKGFSVVTDFWDEHTCTEARNEIDRLIQTYHDQLYRDNTDSDHRIFGADRLSPLIKQLYTDPLIDTVIKLLEGTDDLVGLTMAAKMEWRAENAGSGGGWHRDWAVNKQIKAMIYLSDVSESNGPFQYIEGSQKHLDIIMDGIRGHFTFNQSRFTDDEIQKLLTKKDPQKLHTFTAKAGTLIFFNSRGLHRGQPMQAGSRYALTNYYWAHMPIPSHIEKIIIEPSHV